MKINPKVYEVLCVIRNFKHIHTLLNILQNKEGLILKLRQLIKYYIKRIFIKRYVEYIHHSLLPGLHLVLVNSQKYSPLIQGILPLIIYLEKELSAILKKNIFILETGCFLWAIIMKNKKSLEQVINPFKFFK